MPDTFDGPTITFSGTRGEEWERVLGTRTLPILSPSAEVRKLEGSPDTVTVMLDVRALTESQQSALIDHLARRFNSDRAAVEADVYGRGVPIRLDIDARIDVPPGYQARRNDRLEHGPDVYDMRFFH